MNISKKAILSFIVALTSVISMAQPYYHIMKEVNGKLIEDTVYNGKKYNIKIDMVEPEYRPKDVIGGKITIESTWYCTKSQLKRSFYFTKNGNVYYNKSEDKLHFESSQLDYPSGKFNYNHVGHFHWGSSIKECVDLESFGCTDCGSETTFYFANPNFLRKLQEDLGNERWTVLSACEWQFVCEKLGEYGWIVDGKTCFLIDTTPDKSLLRAIETKNGGKTMSKEDFESYESRGLVCLPTSGIYYDKAKDGKGGFSICDESNGQGYSGYYWSCTPGDKRGKDFFNRETGATWYINFAPKYVREQCGYKRHERYAVRLVVLADD
jgi:hypothetical protein